jgi:adenine-specific DNA-methyltransferase
MPVLHWIGKEKVVSHHQDVPFKVLKHQYGFTAGKAEQYIIYADVCLLDKDYMLKHNIIFKKIPRDIKRF